MCSRAQARARDPSGDQGPGEEAFAAKCFQAGPGFGQFSPGWWSKWGKQRLGCDARRCGKCWGPHTCSHDGRQLRARPVCITGSAVSVKGWAEHSAPALSPLPAPAPPKVGPYPLVTPRNRFPAYPPGNPADLNPQPCMSMGSKWNLGLTSPITPQSVLSWINPSPHSSSLFRFSQTRATPRASEQ